MRKQEAESGPEAESAPESGGLDRRALAQMRRLTQRHTALWQERVPELTKPQYAVLRALAEAPEGLTQAAVGEQVAMDKATLAQLIPRLEARGLMERAVSAEDRRRRVLQLTGEGRELTEECAPRVEALDRETLSPLSAEERAELVRMLDLLAG